MVTVLDLDNFLKFLQRVEESARATREGVKFFIEPAPGTLNRAKTKRHHLIMGRRGSGKSSLLAKLREDLTIDRTPVILVDLEAFKGHSYPDVLVSVLITALKEIETWLSTAAVAPANKTSFWNRFAGKSPTRSPLNRQTIKALLQKIGSQRVQLEQLLHQADEANTQRRDNAKLARASSSEANVKASASQAGLFDASAGLGSKDSSVASKEAEIVSTFVSKKTEFLTRSIITFTALFNELAEASGGPTFLLLDDLYHLRLDDQSNVIDYFHRIAKNSNLWLKIGTIRHRSRWYKPGPPPMGMKLGDDADDIDLDATLDKYELTKRFLMSVLRRLSSDFELELDDFLTDGARDRLVLASGGVARDMLAIFLRAVEVARERLASGDKARGEKIGAEDVNGGVGQFDSTKREEFRRDTHDNESNDLLTAFQELTEFCLNSTRANIVLLEKDFASQTREQVEGLVDLKFMHLVKSRVTVRDRVNRVYDAYMLDMSQYVGERARRNFEIVEFWGKDQETALRRTSFIYGERPRS